MQVGGPFGVTVRDMVSTGRVSQLQECSKGKLSDQLFVVLVIIVSSRSSACYSSASTSTVLKPIAEVARRCAGHGWCDLRHPLQCKGHGMVSATSN